MSLFGNRGINKMILVKFSKYGDQLYGSPVPEIMGAFIHLFSKRLLRSYYVINVLLIPGMQQGTKDT